ncbi:MAG: LptF/LptG family permease [Candidatus Omnitrophica bacterium]|nr:LptF/LptG family permease [Candidatus Omnitrophota bacterium]
MKILQRYIAREILLPFVVCTLVLNFIFMAGYLVRAANFIIGRHVPLLDTLYILMLALPEMAAYTVPTSLLMAVMLVFGHLSQHNELRAMKASGVHLFHVIVPALVIGLTVSFAMIVFNDQVVGQAGFELRKATKKLLIKNPKALIEPGRFVTLNDQIVFLAKEIHGDEMTDIIAYEVEADQKPVRTIMAERGEITTSAGGTEMRVRLFDGSISESESEGVNTMQFQTYEFPPVGDNDLKNMQKKQRELTLAEILVELKNAKEKQMSPSDVLRLKTSFHDRIAFALGSFIFVLIGVPVAVLVRRGEIVVSFAVSMAGVSLYYVLCASAKAIAFQGVLIPAIALWLPNLILFIAGIFLLRKAVLS